MEGSGQQEGGALLDLFQRARSLSDLVSKGEGELKKATLTACLVAALCSNRRASESSRSFPWSAAGVLPVLR